MKYLVRFFFTLLAIAYAELHAAPAYYGYVTLNANPGHVGVINLHSNTVVTTIQVGAYPNGIAVTPDLSRAYVANGGDGTVTVLDLNTQMPVATISVGNPAASLEGIVITPNGTRAYVTSDLCPNGPIYVIDTLPTSPTYNTVIDAISGAGNPYPSSFNDPEYLAITPDGKQLWVPNGGYNTNCGGSLPDYCIVNVIDVATNTVTASIPVGSGAKSVAINPSGTRAYVTDSQGGNNAQTVAVIDTATNTVLTYIPITDISTLTPGPWSIAISPDGQFGYVSNSGSDTVAVFSTATNTQTNLITVGSTPIGVGISPDPTVNSYYIADFGSNQISVIDPVTQTVIDTISGGSIIRPLYWGFAPLASAILPPTNASGQQEAFCFLTRTDRVNVLTWSPPTSGTPPVSYEIFRDVGLTDLAGTVPATQPLVFEDPNRKKGVAYTYYIVAVNAFGGMSTPIIITVQPRKCC